MAITAQISVADPKRFDSDPDPAFHFDCADPVPDPDLIKIFWIRIRQNDRPTGSDIKRYK